MRQLTLTAGALAMAMGVMAFPVPAKAELLTLLCTWHGGNGWIDVTVDVDLAAQTVRMAPFGPQSATTSPAQIDQRYIRWGRVQIDRATGIIYWPDDEPGKCRRASGGF